jgi:hypothetical protein
LARAALVACQLPPTAVAKMAVTATSVVLSSRVEVVGVAETALILLGTVALAGVDGE